MTSLLLAAEGEKAAFNLATSWPLLLMLGLLVVLIIVNIFSKRKQGNKQQEMLNSLKVGDKVVTNAGIYGEIVGITATNFGKILLLKTGEGKNVSYISVNQSVVLGIDEKQPVVLDADGNIVEEPSKEEKTEEKVETKTEVAEEVKENNEQPKVVEQKSKTTKSTKKSTTKKS